MSNQSLPPGASSPRDDDRMNREQTREQGGDATVRDGARDHAAGAPTGSSSSTMALILHAMTFLCCANWIFGVIGIVFAVRAAHKRDQGRFLEAETLTRYSWYSLGAAAVMFVVMFVLSLWIFTQAGSWVEGIAPVRNW
ncbi:hypothetical protein CDO52_05125 [Nocardiopsis gilva YIM 90087]|uniref:Uncharacterized protein n=1 Tax=Nocardiopsis gilva YIM 90087 TaxID=1235441 RepID=A0A223S2K1_9ACTN|nr:hypothetical protein [Nocardiopsis gilva]ASU82249.1 hypothetical protein CDO52_05125 [Nocardiopsis gilva YIM 90087]